jgi:type II secretory pathway component GspD/PulD (secretin)
VIARALDDMRVGRTTTDAFKAIDWPAKKVFISAKVVEVTSDDEAFGLTFLSSTLATETAKPGDQAKESTKAENRAPALIPAGPDGKPVALEPGIISLTGVFTDPQFQVIIRALSQMKGVSLLSMPSATVTSAQAASMKAGAVECEVTPAIGADGYTMDLTIVVSEKPGGAGEHQPRNVSTAVTIWDGQTVVLGGRISKIGEKPARHRLVFVTAQLIMPSGEAKKSTR